MEAFDAFGSLKPTLREMIFTLMGPLLPRLTANLPTEQGKVAKVFSDGVREIAGKLLAKDAEDKPTVIDKSILGALSSCPQLSVGAGIYLSFLTVKSETASAVVQMSIEEIHAQVRVFFRFWPC